MQKYVEWHDKEDGSVRRIIGELVSDSKVTLVVRDDLEQLYFIERLLIIKEADSEECEICGKWSFTTTTHDATRMCGMCRLEAERLGE